MAEVMMIAERMDRHQLELYNAHRREYQGLMETLFRFHLVARRRVRAARRWPRMKPLTFEEKLPVVIRDWFRVHQLMARQKFFQGLSPLGIPNDPHFIDMMEWQDDKSTSLGKRILYYESPALGAFVPINMIHRYRGMPRSCNSIKSIKFLKLLGREEEGIIRESKKEKAYVNPYLSLEKAAVSKYHFRFLKDVAEAQLVTIPFSILATAMEDVFPYYEDLYQYYCFHFSDANRKSKEVIKRRGRVNDKIQYFNRL